MPILTLQSEIHTCPADRRYRIELDPKEAVPDDPGQGTPAMVYGPHGASGTFDCVNDTGELDEQSLPPAVLSWLEGMEEYVNDYVDAAYDAARVKAAEDGAAAPGMSPG